MKKIISITVITMLAAILLCGCCGGSSRSDKKLTKYYSDSPVIAASFYLGDEFYELPQDQLPAFCEKLDSMELERHVGHVDYYWAYQFGIELSLEDGTFINYDGTKYNLFSTSLRESHDSENKLHGCFLEVTNMDFWAEIREFFPNIPEELYTGW